MSWPEVVLAAIGASQVIALAWIASRQVTVKRSLEAYNGHTLQALDEVRRGIDDLSGTRHPQ